MNNDFQLETMIMGKSMEIDKLVHCNNITEKFGLTLSMNQIQNLVECRSRALKNTNRVEFGDGIMSKLIYEFCDSMYVNQDNYEDTLIKLQDMFYYFKNESMELLSDDEIIEAMKKVFDGKAAGSLEYLESTFLENMCRSVREGKGLNYIFNEEEDMMYPEDEEYDE